MSNLAVFGGPKAVTGTWPAWPVVDESEKRAVTEVLMSGKWWMGPKVEEFEQRFAALHDTAWGVACCNGTVAIEMALKACGIGAGDEVIVPPYTFIATATAVLMVNAVPIFADIEPDTLNIDPAALESLITSRTRAIIPVHFGGLPCDLDRISAIAKRHNLVVIEDAAHSWGSQWRGRGVGADSAAATFSFQMSKNVTSGEGGLLISNDQGIADRAWSHHHVGRTRNGAWYDHPLLGSNYRLTELQAAILLCQLERLAEHNARREASAAILRRRLSALSGFKLPPRDERVTRRSWHMFDLFLNATAWDGVSRERLLEALQAEGVPCSAGYIQPLYRNGLFQQIAAGAGGCPFTCPYREVAPPDYSALHLPNVERAVTTTIWLSHVLLLGDDQVMNEVATAFEKVWEGRALLRG